MKRQVTRHCGAVSGRHRMDPTTLMVTVVIVTAVFTALLWLSSGLGASAVTLILLVATLLCLAFVPSFAALFSRNLDPFNPKYLITANYALSLAIYPVYSVLTETTQLPGWYFAAPENFGIYLEVMLLALAGLVCYYVGYASSIRMDLVAKSRSKLQAKSAVLWYVVFLYFAIGIIATVAFVTKYQGVLQFLQNRESWRSVVSGDGPMVVSMNTFLPGAAIIVMLIRTEQAGHPVKLKHWLFFALCLLPSLLMGFRIMLAPPIMQALAIQHYRVRRFTTRQLALASALLLLLFGGYGIMRNSDRTTPENWTAASLASHLSNRSAGTEVVAVVVHGGDAGNYEYGLQSALDALIVLVPRQIWPDKPRSWGEQFATRWFAPYFYMREGAPREFYGGVSPTAIGYLHRQGGWFGVVVGMFSLGILTRLLYEYGRQQTRNAVGFLLYLVLFPQLIIAAESPQAALNGAVINFLLYWLPLASLGQKRLLPFQLARHAFAPGPSIRAEAMAGYLETSGRK